MEPEFPAEDYEGFTVVPPSNDSGKNFSDMIRV